MSKSKKPNYLKIGKFKKKNVYDVDVDMSEHNRSYFLDLGKQVITEDQYVNIGFNYALLKGLELAEEIAKKNKK
jgi:hypothetical protein